jgi:hypothetical protein
MPVEIIIGHAQIDGRRYVREIHSDAQGVIADLEYLAAIGADTNAIAAARSTEIVETLARSEAKRMVEIDAAPVLRFQTGAQFLVRLRSLYRGARRERCAKIAAWIIHRLDAGDVTAAQLRNVFNLTVQQWNTLETKLRALASSIAAIESAEGE